MKNNKFKVMDWLRKIRDEHSLQSFDKPWNELQDENAKAIERFTKRTEILQKKITPPN